ncbi:MAG: Hsp33 family molecular chaperone HslO [Pseudomonadota bacterium]
MAEFGMSQDHLQRLLLEQANARCVVVHLDSVYQQVLARGPYPHQLGRMLGETLVVAALCSSGVKFDGRISLQLRAPNVLKLMMADCTDDGGLRGLARFDESEVEGQTFQSLTRGGVLTMTIEPSDRGQTWQGMVPLEGHSMAEAIGQYFERSEQLPTRLLLAVSKQQAAGVLLQRLPGPANDPDGWNRLCQLFDTAQRDELLSTDAQTLMHRLFHEEERRLFPPRPLRFFCPCSRERVVTVLRGLGETELESIIEDEGEIDVSCEFCNQRFAFDRLDVAQLLHQDAAGMIGEDDADGQPTVH